MSGRRARIVLLCEDRQHEAFARRFFESVGWHRRSIRVIKSPLGRGAGEQWVRERFPRELSAVRKAHVDVVLVAIVDADRETVEERLTAFDRFCAESGVPARTSGDRVAVLVARRNIETWIAYLRGQKIDEQRSYDKLKRQRDCKPDVKRLVDMCRSGRLHTPAPPSLEHACREYRDQLTP